MKRVLWLVFLLCFLLTLTTVGLAEKYIVNTEETSLNIRSVEDSSIILGGIAKGKTIDIDYTDKFWAYFTYKGQPAKVYKYYLKPASGSPSQGSSINVGSGKSGGSKKNEISTEDASMIYTVSNKVKSYITVRKTKNEYGKILGKVYPGDDVYVIAVGSTWARIIYEGQYGFIKAEYLVNQRYNLPEEGILYRVVVKKNTTLNVREEGKKRGKVIFTLSNGAFVKVIDMQETWSHVYYSMSRMGFVMNKFLEKAE